MAVSDALAKLAHELLDDILAQSQIVQSGARTFGKGLAPTTVADRKGLHVLLQIKIEEFEDEIQLMALTAVGMDNVEEAHNVGVAHLLEQRDLADGGGGDALIFGFEADLLEGNNAPAVGQVAGLVDDTIRSYAEGGMSVFDKEGREPRWMG